MQPEQMLWSSHCREEGGREREEGGRKRVIY